MDIKVSNGEKIIGSFNEKELLLSKLQMSYPESDSHISIKIIIVLVLTNYATKKESNDAAGV